MENKKSKIYSILAALSLLLLTAFLAYWNYDNYQRSKAELQQDLADQMELAVAGYQDSIISRIFTTVIVDSLTSETDLLDLSIELSEGSVTHSFTQHSHNISGPRGEDEPSSSAQDSTLTFMYDAELDRKIIVWNTDVGPGPVSVRFDTSHLESIDLTHFAARDTQFFLQDSSIRSHTSKDLPPIYATINELYRDRLNEASLLLDHIITTHDQTEHNSDMSIPFTYGNLQGDYRPHAVFQGYHAYLLKGMLPNVIISLLLLSAIGTTFFIILKNWKAQLQLTAVKDEFISNMTHELKTPISTVGVALEALGTYGIIDDAEKRKEYLDISKLELERLNILVDKVLKMSTLDQDLDKSSFNSVDMKKLTEQVLHSMHLLFKKNNTQISYTHMGSDFTIQGDKVHLINVLYNIIDNAIKYSDEDPELSIELSSTSHGITLSLSDKGRGIPAAYLSKIFDRLFRVPTADKHNVKGHGLGLHYARSVIEKHNGTITAASELGKGTTFTIQLPQTS